MARKDPQVNIRIPFALKEKIEAAAGDAERSLTAEIVHRLEQSFEQTRVIEQLAEALEFMKESVETTHDVLQNQSQLINLLEKAAMQAQAAPGEAGNDQRDAIWQLIGAATKSVHDSAVDTQKLSVAMLEKLAKRFPVDSLNLYVTTKA